MNTPGQSSIDDLIDAELGRYLAPAVLKDNRKQSLDLSNKIRGLQKTNVRREKVKGNIAEVQDGILPKGFRPFSHTFETHLLDDMVSQDGISVTVDTSMSIRDTKRKFHMEHLKVQLELDLQLLDKHRQQLKTHIRKEAFLDRCLANFPAFAQAHRKASAYLDLDDSDADIAANLELRGLSSDQAKAKILAIYRKVVDAEVEVKRAQEEKQAAERKRQHEVMQEVIRKSPEEFLIEAIDSRIAQSKDKKAPAGRTRKDKQKYEMNSAGLACQAMSGMIDEESISQLVYEKRPETRHGKGKGKGKGKVPSKMQVFPQGKGKGKGRNPKGKGKGKNKGKLPVQEAGLPKNGLAPHKGGKSTSKGKGKATTKGKAQGKKGNGKGFWTGSARGRWQ